MTFRKIRSRYFCLWDLFIYIPHIRTSKLIWMEVYRDTSFYELFSFVLFFDVLKLKQKRREQNNATLPYLKITLLKQKYYTTMFSQL